MSTARKWFGARHPVASVARALCRVRHDVGRGVACGECWERAVRDDERAVVLFGVPRVIEPDPDYVDEVAVERACAGERVRLTRLERATVARRLLARAVPVAARLGMSNRDLSVLLADTAPVLDEDIYEGTNDVMGEAA